MKTTSKVIVHTALRPSDRVEFSDLVRGTFFMMVNPHEVLRGALFIVGEQYKKDSANRGTSDTRSGIAICLNYPGKTYPTASDNCFPKGVEVVDVEIVVKPQPGKA